jgi:hypothetical protein
METPEENQCLNYITQNQHTSHTLFFFGSGTYPYELFHLILDERSKEFTMGQNNQNSKLESQGPRQGATPGRQDQDQDMQKKQAEERARKQSEDQKNKQSPKRDSDSSDSEQV